MPKFLTLEERQSATTKFKIARIRNDEEQVVMEVDNVGTALDIVSAFSEAGPFMIYNDLGMICHFGY